MCSETHYEEVRLFAGSRLIGILKVDAFDYPKWFAAFEPTAIFDDVRELFEKQNASYPFGDARDQLDALDLRIVYSDGYVEPLLTIVIRAQRAMWRLGFMRATQIRRHNAFWRVLGDEIGPEGCGEPGCSRLRIGLSAFCRRHHFRMIMGEDYSGTLGDG